MNLILNEKPPEKFPKEPPEKFPKEPPEKFPKEPPKEPFTVTQTSNTVFTVNFRSEKFHFYSSPDLPLLIQEIFSDNYHVLSSGITFPPCGIILDIGANEGVWCIMMAKLFPQAIIHAFEPVPRTYQSLLKNIALNNVANITPFPSGIGKAPGKATMNVSKDYSGGSSSLIAYNPADHVQVEANILSLDDVITNFCSSHVRLMKIDIEGMEYEAVYHSTLLHQIDYVVGEFHTNWKLEYENCRPFMLANWIENRTELLHYDYCKMAE